MRVVPIVIVVVNDNHIAPIIAPIATVHDHIATIVVNHGAALDHNGVVN